ncbi:NAD(P)/FAD-dependent oxidoreductase [Fictibacillus aquaticus]|uniref:FAD-dependent oxidoreductase n=1 Tax=Fictibacillus aquaticus TaxID=2021314 RepID=A0A235FBA2_9BACL|nr:FAD-dependent oxidoreductase [Fictibacillus aquaticus]OYD58630.1 FAD-dependent oxidoreductase [Fictibacillus aquaticus]
MKKFIIVGAGILGASAAYHLAKSGADVMVVDRHDAGQATDAAAGIICPWISQRRNKAWYELVKNGARYYPKLIAELEREGQTETGYAKVGAISLHQSLEKLQKMYERALKRKDDAPEMGEISILTKEETKALFPLLHDQYAAVHVSGAARVNGRALRDALLQAAQSLGAEIISSDAALLFEKGKVTGVKTRNQRLEADCVIVCAGAWAAELVKPIVSLNVTYQKAQIAHMYLPAADTKKWPVVMPPSDQYILAFDNGEIVAGATHENDISGYDTRVTSGGIQEVMNKALDTCPGLHNSSFVEMRVGFRPFTPGFLPVIGEIPGWKGILLANGLGASGLTMGPFLGSELAKLALGEKLEIDLELYKVESAIER